MRSDVKERCDCVLVNLGADYAQPADNFGAAAADVGAAGNVVKVDPASVGRLNDALCTKDCAVLFFIFECFESRKDLFFGELAGRFASEAREYLVGMMMVMMLMIVVMTAAALVMILVVVMIVLVMVMMMFMMFMFFVFIMIVVMVFMLMIVVMIAAALVMMLVVMFIFVMVMIVMVVMFVLMLQRVSVRRFGSQLSQFGLKGGLLLHRGKNLFTCQLIPRS